MSYDLAVTAIQQRFEALWVATEPTVPICFENEAFNPPKPRAEWIMLRVDWTGGDFITIGAPGNNVTRRLGHIWVHAFIPSGTGGVTRAHKMASEAGTIFEGQDFSGVVCEGAMPGGPAGSEDGAYYGQSVAIPFYYDEEA